MTFSRTATVSRRSDLGTGKSVHVWFTQDALCFRGGGCGMVSGLSEHSTVTWGPVPAASVSAALRASLDAVLETKLHIPPVRKD